MEHVGHHAPDFHVAVVVNLPGLIGRIFGFEPPGAVLADQAFDGAFALDHGHDDVVVVGFQLLVDRQ